MLGLLGIGIALTFGAGMRIAAAAGALMYILMWSVVLPPENHPFLDEHVLGALTLVVLAMFYAGDTWGLGRWWSQIPHRQEAPRSAVVRPYRDRGRLFTQQAAAWHVELRRARHRYRFVLPDCSDHGPCEHSQVACGLTPWALSHTSMTFIPTMT